MDEMKVAMDNAMDNAMEIDPKVFRAKVLAPVVHTRLSASCGFVPLKPKFKSKRKKSRVSSVSKVTEKERNP